MLAHADRGPPGPKVDSDVAGDAGSGSAGGEGRCAEGEPSEAGDTAGRSDFTAAGEPILALVRQGVPRPARAGPLGQGETGALCRRLRRAGALFDAQLARVDRGEVGNLDGVGDQPREDAGGEPERETSAPGLSGVHVPIRPRPERA